MIIDHTVIIALFWWAGNCIPPKMSVFFYVKNPCQNRQGLDIKIPKQLVMHI